jgi:Holliday junction DNA helicase RuvA
MIGKLQGIIDYVGVGFAIVMAGGVGYKVMLPVGVLAGLRVGDQIALWIETIVREDAISLIGFQSLAEQDMFVKLTGVSGVGPKSALAILGSFKPGVLATAISTEDVKTLTIAPGVGKKVAERIIVELKGKFDGAGLASFGAGGAYADTLSALEALGYKRADIVDMVQKLSMENPTDSAQSLITKALKEVANNR